VRYVTHWRHPLRGLSTPQGVSIPAARK
jgi:hypothetical protein